ncbi:MAG: succinyl-diaminopimelate desuccinylase [Alphaproteobacteria bacterium]|nr:succinyl-diaminopimelate desuccinylase [Alphaproteobacteria bacterium]
MPRETAADLLKALIRCRSITPADDGALDVVEGFLKPAGFACTRLPFSGDGSYRVDNLFATWGRGQRHLLFCGHVDVVPPGNQSDWRHDPFSAMELDGEIWGRGAVDMKSGVAAFCAAATEFLRRRGGDDGRISILITGDEEADAVNGAKKVLQWAAEQGHKFDFGLVGEPTSAKLLGDRIKVGRRGSLSGKITVAGTQGHTAYPHLAHNPLPVLAQIAVALSVAHFDDGTKNFSPTNLQLTSLDVGNGAANIIPAAGSLSFNIRFTDLWSEHRLGARIEKIIAGIPAPGCAVSLQIRQPVSNWFVSADASEVDVLAKAIETVCRRTPERSTSGGTSDGRFVANYCPVAEFGLVGELLHKVDERVSTDQLLELGEIYAHFLDGFFKGISRA